MEPQIKTQNRGKTVFVLPFVFFPQARGQLVPQLEVRTVRLMG